MWFAQVEAQFATRNPPIEADLTKYNYVTALDNVAAGEVEALIWASPATNKVSCPQDGTVTGKLVP